MRRIGLCQLNRHDKKDLNINYINQALIQDVIENNHITTIFQNDTRPRSGKFNQPLNPDMMIKMVLKAYRNLQKLKYDIKIVPVCINYDRIFDISFLVGEMVSGEFKPGTTLIDVAQRILKMEEGKLGKIFVKYVEPIDLNEYVNLYMETVADKNAKKLSPTDFESLSLKLTKDLYRIQ